MQMLAGNECPSSKVLLKNIAHTRKAFLDIYGDSSDVGNLYVPCPQCKLRLKHASNGSAANLGKHITIQHLGKSSGGTISGAQKAKLVDFLKALQQRKSRRQ